MKLKPLKRFANPIAARYSDVEGEIRDILLSVREYTEKAEKEGKKVVRRVLSEEFKEVKAYVPRYIELAYWEAVRESRNDLIQLGKIPVNEFNGDQTLISKQTEMLMVFQNGHKIIERRCAEYFKALKYAKGEVAKLQFFNWGMDTILEEEIDEIIEEANITRERVIKRGSLIHPDFPKGGKYTAALSRWEVQKQITSLFHAKFGNMQLIQILCKDGKLRHYRPSYFFKMMARTKMREVQTGAVKDTCYEYDNDLVRFSKHANPCDICADREGEIYSLSGKHPVYPPLDEEAPLHNNCEHHIEPTSDTAIAIDMRWAA